jgi:hypothetical protein
MAKQRTCKLGNSELHEKKQDNKGQKRAKELTVDRLPLAVQEKRDVAREPYSVTRGGVKRKIPA